MTRREPAAISDVRCEVAEVQAEETRVLVLAFHGSYRDGSRGTRDATRMREPVRHGAGGERRDD